MKDATGNRILGKTRWRRFAIVYGLAMGMIVTVLALAAFGAISVPIVITGQPFSLKGDALHATNFTQYGDIDWIGPVGTGTPKGVGVTVIGTLDDGNGNGIVNLDQTVCGDTHLPITNHFLLLEITGSTVTASNLVADVTDLTTGTEMTTSFNNLAVGVPVTSREGSATFGQTASSFDITRDVGSTQQFKQTALFTQAGTFAVRNLGLHASLQSSCPA